MPRFPYPRRILVISEIGCGPPYAGNRARMKSLLQEVKALGYEIDFAGVDLTQQEMVETKRLVDRWVASFNKTVTPTLWNRICKKFAKFLGCIRPVDSVQAELIPGLDERFVIHWLPEAIKLQKKNQYALVLVSYVFHSAFLYAFPLPCKKILDTHDSFSDRKQKLEEKGISDYWFSLDQAQEAAGLRRSDAVLAIQAEEAAFFRTITNNSIDVHVVGHFARPVSIPWSSHSALKIGYVGSENPINIKSFHWFLKEVWPGVLDAAPACRLLVAGSICRHLPTTASVELIGEISDLADFHSQCLLSINPMLGGTGLKIKTIESLAFGRAVVGTESAAEGLLPFVGNGLYIARNCYDFISILVQLLNNPKQARDSGSKAIGLVEQLNVEYRNELKKVLVKST
jgi:glycosyltransferase involved in cell wall biosynthesis